MRSVRLFLALVITIWATQWTFEQLMGVSGWNVAAALICGGIVGALTFTVVNDGPTALVGAVLRGRSARR